MNSVIINQAVFNNNYWQCVINVLADNTTLSLINTSLNLLLPTGNGTLQPINASIIVERYS